MLLEAAMYPERLKRAREAAGRGFLCRPFKVFPKLRSKNMKMGLIPQTLAS